MTIQPVSYTHLDVYKRQAESFGNPTGDALVKVVRRERMNELIFEGHWLYDLKMCIRDRRQGCQVAKCWKEAITK